MSETHVYCATNVIYLNCLQQVYLFNALKEITMAEAKFYCQSVFMKQKEVPLSVIAVKNGSTENSLNCLKLSLKNSAMTKIKYGYVNSVYFQIKLP